MSPWGIEILQILHHFFSFVSYCSAVREDTILKIKTKLHKMGFKKVVLLYVFCRQMFCELGPRGEGGYSEEEQIHVLGFKPIPKFNNSLQ